MTSFRFTVLVALTISLNNIFIEAAKRNDMTDNLRDDIYTTSWVVEITGGKEMADEVADEYGFNNLGKLKVLYHKIYIVNACI